MPKQRDMIEEKETSKEEESELFAYPVDPSLLMNSSDWVLDTEGIPQQVELAGYHPTMIAFYALERWNQYLVTCGPDHRDAFLQQVQWLMTHAVHIGDDAIGWTVTSPRLPVKSGPCLSAIAQGSGLSVLMRAYQLTRSGTMLDTIHRVVRTFERDILDGGIQSPIGDSGIFFEENAVYPATHSLQGCIVALFGLYDYIAVIRDDDTENVIRCCLDTLHRLLDEFDAGFWTYADLQLRCLASPTLLTLQSLLLEALARYADCDHCLQISARWKGYQLRRASRWRYLLVSKERFWLETLRKHLRSMLVRHVPDTPFMRVCIPVTAFPVIGGIRTVLASVAQAMESQWHIEYLTQHRGPNPTGLAIHQFGTKRMTPWQFPAIWLYILAGWYKLISLLRSGVGYQVFLPQDGVATAAFTALAAKMVEAHVVSIDHGSLTILKSPAYRAERLQALERENWSRPRLLFAQWRYRWYWLSLSILARLSARCTNHFLIPGVVGDGVEEACRDLGIRVSQITRFASMVDVDQYPVLDETSKEALRTAYGVPTDAIVVAIACRLSPEKGLDITLEALSRVCSRLSEVQRSRVRIIIAGDGPLREKIESDLSAHALAEMVTLWGETAHQDVIALLSLSDIFFYTSVRGACFSMAVLEAMAADCAVIASTQPFSNEKLLAERRGIAISAGDPEQAAQALVCLLADEDLRHRMGKSAREYIATYHSETGFRRMLQRATYWSELDSLLHGN